MDTISLDGAVKFSPSMLQEIDSNSDVGPYDDDGDTKRYSSSAHEVDSLLNVRMSLQKRQRKAPRN
jgi:hypothetical protein